MGLYSKTILSLSLACCAALSHRAYAQGNLLVTPRRIVFEGPKRTEEINLANTGKDTARYVISTTEMIMREDGSFVMLGETDSVQNPASSYIRFFPHTVVLAPNEAQLVKVQLSKYSQLKPGEYRSHMYFRAKAPEVALGDTVAKDAKSISVSITPTFGLSIPVIIRIGENATKVSISDISVSTADNDTKLSMVLHREGNMSVYGDIIVNHISPKGKITRVGYVKGIAVYTTIDRRHFSMPLSKEDGVDYHSGKLNISFTENNSLQDKVAEGDLTLN